MVERQLPLAPLLRLAKEAGVERVSDDAKELIGRKADELIIALWKEANEKAKADKRVTILLRDLE